MASLTVISGCPGTGKTTLSKHLADLGTMGVRIDTDAFYHFFAHRLDPSTPESKAQNTTVVRAFLQAANAYYEDGYDVVVDGVLGPWWLDVMQRELPTFEYALLHANRETVLRRTSERAKASQASANSTLVQTMHGQFDALSGMERRTINTTGKIPSQVVEAFMQGRRDGDFTVPTSDVSQHHAPSLAAKQTPADDNVTDIWLIAQNIELLLDVEHTLMQFAAYTEGAMDGAYGSSAAERWAGLTWALRKWFEDTGFSPSLRTFANLEGANEFQAAIAAVEELLASLPENKRHIEYRKAKTMLDLAKQAAAKVKDVRLRVIAKILWPRPAQRRVSKTDPKL